MLGLSLPAFAELIGFPLRTMQGWEQGRSCPVWPALSRTIWLHMATLKGEEAAAEWAQLPGQIEDRASDDEAR